MIRMLTYDCVGRERGAEDSPEGYVLQYAGYDYLLINMNQLANVSIHYGTLD